MCAVEQSLDVEGVAHFLKCQKRLSRPPERFLCELICDLPSLQKTLDVLNLGLDRQEMDTTVAEAIQICGPYI